MYSNIVVPYDRSDHARHALAGAIRLAAGEDEARITVLNVADLPDLDDATYEVAARMAGIVPPDQATSQAARENYMRQCEEEVREDTADLVADVPAGIVVDFAVVGGHPQEAICDFVAGGDFDCIVMGRRGLGAIRGALGSVSYAVLRSTDLPVLIVK